MDIEILMFVVKKSLKVTSLPDQQEYIKPNIEILLSVVSLISI